MCGFCFEQTTLDFLESEILNTEFVRESAWTPIYIQEANDLIEILQRTQDTTGFPYSLDVALCRLYDVYILQGCQCSLFDYLVSMYQKDKIAKFFDDRVEFWAKNPSSLTAQEFWLKLWHEDTYRNPSVWADFTHDTDRLVKESELLLKNYCDWWMLEKDEEDEEAVDVMDDVPQSDRKPFAMVDAMYDAMVAAIDTAQNDGQQFESVFPAVYFAFLVLRKYRPHSEVIRLIAVRSLKNTPDFFGYDLWLQRKAFLVCIQQYGFSFMVENLKDIRLELIAYAILKWKMTLEDREHLKDLMSNYEYGIIGLLEPDNITQLVNDAQAREALGV